MDRRFMFVKKMSPGGCLPLSLGYIHAYNHNIQTSSHDQESWSKMAAMAINSKNLYKSFSSEPEDL